MRTVAEYRTHADKCRELANLITIPGGAEAESSELETTRFDRLALVAAEVQSFLR